MPNDLRHSHLLPSVAIHIANGSLLSPLPPRKGVELTLVDSYNEGHPVNSGLYFSAGFRDWKLPQPPRSVRLHFHHRLSRHGLYLRIAPIGRVVGGLDPLNSILVEIAVFINTRGQRFPLVGQVVKGMWGQTRLISLDLRPPLW